MLLDKVKREYPGVVRFVLSGHADGDAIAKAVPVTHQFLTKPCDPEVLSAVIERACNSTIGGYLLDMWGLPISVVEAVTHHHTPRLVSEGQRDILAAVHVADAMANGLWNRNDATPPIIDLEFIAEAGLSELLEKWRDIADIDARIIQQTQGRGTDPLFAATFG